MKNISYIVLLVLGVLTTGCQNKDIEILAPAIEPLDANLISGELAPNGIDYIWSWPVQNGKRMQIGIYAGEQMLGSFYETQENTFTHANLESNVDYTYIFKLSDGTNYSVGVAKHFTREGISPVSALTMRQDETQNAGVYNAILEWTPSPENDGVVDINASNGSRNIKVTLPGSTSTYTIENVAEGESWQVSVQAKKDHLLSIPVFGSLTIGKTAIGFLSVYPDPETLVAEGDDDDASAWLWLHSEYPTAQFIYFGDITSADDLNPYRVLFWMRDLEGVDEGAVFNMGEIVDHATPAIKEWYINGGSLLLWSHAIAYVTKLGRLEESQILGNDHLIATGFGGWNPDIWKMAVQLHPGSRFKKDHSSHPIYQGLDVEETDRTKLIAFKGPGWTEDHNFVFYNLPPQLTGLDWQTEECYNALTQSYGIIPLGTWDSQIDWISQLNVWEAQQGNTEFKGTILCIGNGGCEFSMKNADGTPDKSAYPKNNPYQGNVLKLAKNSLEYLKTR